MANDWIGKATTFFMGGSKSHAALAEEGGAQAQDGDFSFETSSSIGRALMGNIGTLGAYHFPADLIGGCCPRVAGEEEDIVWNAAAEAADTERVHVVWQAKGDRIWYLAVRSADISSNPNTWCPFGALLPGMKEAADPPTIYTYFSDESATMMTVLPEGLQIHRGTTSVIRAKAERTSRELENAPIIEMIPDRIEKLTPVPWYSLSLFEERARRVLATLAVVGAILFAGLAMVIWLAAAMATVSARADIKEITERSEQKSLQLMKMVQNQRASPMREQLARFADVNDSLLGLNGYLEIYQIKSNKAIWRAVLPANVTSDRINEMGGQTLDANAQGVVIGSSREALNLGREGKK